MTTTWMRLLRETAKSFASNAAEPVEKCSVGPLDIVVRSTYV